MKLNIDDKIMLSTISVAALVFLPILLTAFIFVLSFGIVLVPTYVGFFTMYSTTCWIWVCVMTYIWGFAPTEAEE